MRECLLCPEMIPYRHRLCRKCYQLYHEHIHDPWYRALLEMQYIQERINAREQYQLSAIIQIDMYGRYTYTPIDSKRPIGRPSTDRKDVEEVLRLFDQSVENELQCIGKRLSVRSIEKVINKRVKHTTIWKILKKYRSNIFPAK